MQTIFLPSSASGLSTIATGLLALGAALIILALCTYILWKSYKKELK